MINWSGKGYWSSRISRLNKQFDAKIKRKTPPEGTCNLFKDLSFHINGATKAADSINIQRMILENEGQYHFYPSSETDIIIADEISESKKKVYSSGQFKGVYVLSSFWITESIKNGQLQDPTRKRYLKNLKTIDNSFVHEVYKQIVAHRKKDAVENDGQISDTSSTFEFTQIQPKPDEKMIFYPKSFENFDIDKDPNIVKTFFEKSRLSHIANWKKEFTDYIVQKIESKKSENREATYILHIDMDCFFVSIAIDFITHSRTF